MVDTSTRDEGTSWGWLLAVIAAVAILLAFISYLGGSNTQTSPTVPNTGTTETMPAEGSTPQDTTKTGGSMPSEQTR